MTLTKACQSQQMPYVAMPSCRHSILSSQALKECAAGCHLTTFQRVLPVRLRSLHWLNQAPLPAQQGTVQILQRVNILLACGAVHGCYCLTMGSVWGSASLLTGCLDSAVLSLNSGNCKPVYMVGTASKLLMNELREIAECK